MTKEISIRLNERLAAKVDKLAAVAGRPADWLIKRMIEDYIDEELRLVKEIREAVDDYKAGKNEWIPHEVVMREMDELLRAKLGDAEFERLIQEEEARSEQEKRKEKQKQRR